MPEYLAPEVYVEEVDTGSKPIEGVSTSTAGMIGVTERGPVNVPILITSYGEYRRWFGERLRPDLYSNRNDYHCYLPPAVEGFFVNGGKRVYITRVLDTVGASRAIFDLHDRGPASPIQTRLLLAAREGDGGAAAPLYILNQTGFTAGPPPTRVRIGDGSDAEYRDFAAAPAGPTHVPLSFPLGRGHASTVTVHDINRVAAAAPNAFTLAIDAEAGTASIVVTSANDADLSALVVDDLLEIGSQFAGELRFVVGIDPVVAGPPATRRIFLDSPLAMRYPMAPTTNVTRLNPAPGDGNEIANNTLRTAASSGGVIVFLTAPRNNFDQRTQLIIFERANNTTQQARREARRIGNLSLLQLSTGAYAGYPASALVQHVSASPTVGVTAKHLTADVRPGDTILPLNDRVGLGQGSVLRVGTAPDDEYVTLVDQPLPNPSPGNAPPNSKRSPPQAAGL